MILKCEVYSIKNQNKNYFFQFEIYILRDFSNIKAQKLVVKNMKVETNMVI